MSRNVAAAALSRSSARAMSPWMKEIHARCCSTQAWPRRSPLVREHLVGRGQVALGVGELPLHQAGEAPRPLRFGLAPSVARPARQASTAASNDRTAPSKSPAWLSISAEQRPGVRHAHGVTDQPAPRNVSMASARAASISCNSTRAAAAQCDELSPQRIGDVAGTEHLECFAGEARRPAGRHPVERAAPPPGRTSSPPWRPRRPSTLGHRPDLAHEPGGARIMVGDLLGRRRRTRPSRPRWLGPRRRGAGPAPIWSASGRRRRAPTRSGTSSGHRPGRAARRRPVRRASRAADACRAPRRTAPARSQVPDGPSTAALSSIVPLGRAEPVERAATRPRSVSGSSATAPHSATGGPAPRGTAGCRRCARAARRAGSSAASPAASRGRARRRRPARGRRGAAARCCGGPAAAASALEPGPRVVSTVKGKPASATRLARAGRRAAGRPSRGRPRRASADRSGPGRDRYASTAWTISSRARAGRCRRARGVAEQVQRARVTRCGIAPSSAPTVSTARPERFGLGAGDVSGSSADVACDRRCHRVPAGSTRRRACSARPARPGRSACVGPRAASRTRRLLPTPPSPSIGGEERPAGGCTARRMPSSSSASLGVATDERRLHLAGRAGRAAASGLDRQPRLDGFLATPGLHEPDAS